MKNIIKKIKKYFKFLFSKKKNNKKMGTSIVVPNSTLIIDTDKKFIDKDLVDDNIDEKDKKQLRQYTKTIVTTLLICAIIWVSWSFILVTIALIKYMQFEPLQSLSEKICEVIIGVVISYCLKSFLETFCQKKNEIDLMNLHNNDDTTLDTNNDIDIVG